jgi:hypothetical protein
MLYVNLLGGSIHTIKKQDRQCMYSLNITLKCLQETTVAVEKQQWPVWLYHSFPHYRMNNITVGKKLWNKQCTLWLSLQLFSEIFVILMRIQQNIVINVHRSSRNIPVTLVRFLWNLNFLDIFSKNNQYQISWKSIQWKPSYSMWMDGQTGRQSKQTDMTKLIVTLQNFANAPTNRSFISH